MKMREFFHKNEKRLPAVALVIKTATADFITGKIETQGSIFSNETRFREAACVPFATSEKSSLSFFTITSYPFLDPFQALLVQLGLVYLLQLLLLLIIKQIQRLHFVKQNELL